MDIYEKITKLRDEGRRAALATISSVHGSVPSFETAKMLVRDDGTIEGSIGGGCVEAEVWQAAREVIEQGTPRTLGFNLNKNPKYDTGLVCGGSLEIFIEPLLPGSTAMGIYEELVLWRREGRRAALATIIGVHGSNSFSVSSKLLVGGDGTTIGNIGGGGVEAEVTQAAREVIEKEKPRTLVFNLDEHPEYATGQNCGGSLEIFIEPLLPVTTVYIFGAGHVGLNVYRVARIAGFEVVLADDRESYANRERFPEAREIHAEEFDRTMAQLEIPKTAFIVIATRGHRDDMRVLRWAVGTSASYIGMIGSKRKVLTIYRELEKEGIAPDALARVSAPVGLDIGARTPEEIGISVVAELIAVRRNAETAMPRMRLFRKPTQAAS